MQAHRIERSGHITKEDRESMNHCPITDLCKDFFVSMQGKFDPKTRWRSGFAIAPHTWFQVGGACNIFFRPASIDDLQLFLKEKPTKIPYFILGAGSNIIIRDAGFRGVIIRLGRAFSTIDFDDISGMFSVGAAALDMTVAMEALEKEHTGLEFLSGIPGTIGGAVRMNAGAYGSEINDVLTKADFIMPDGTLVTLSNKECGFSYRHSTIPPNAICIRAYLQSRPGNKTIIAKKIQEIQDARAATQPIKGKTGGSTFKNPDGHKAWDLVDRAGCRGLMVGDAQMSEKHCNFMLNLGSASAQDLEKLGEEVRSRVASHFDINLEWEIKRIGEPTK